MNMQHMIRRLGIALMLGALAVSAAAEAATRPRIKILATGGTIAGAQTSQSEYGYTSGSFNVQDLINAVPQMKDLADISGEQIVNIGSQDMNDEVWLKLANRLTEVLAANDTDGVVITHGTDTVEETAYFLDLVVKSDKPIVLAGSMRPATAISADGPMNLYNAMAIASDPQAKGRGVLVALNDTIHAAREITKTNTSSIQTFESVNRGPAGLVNTGKITWFEVPGGRRGSKSEFTIKGLTTLPRVDIIYAHANMSTDLIDAAVKHGARGLVIAGVGDGNMTQKALDACAAAAKSGVVIVRSSRLPSGLTYRNNEVNDDKYGFVASLELNPPKSRVLLQQALLKTTEVKDIQRMFREY
jgi:L-asparaginase